MVQNRGFVAISGRSVGVLAQVGDPYAGPARESARRAAGRRSERNGRGAGAAAHGRM